jgi:methylenetetrahydrofolate reductase (NADPH)
MGSHAPTLGTPSPLAQMAATLAAEASLEIGSLDNAQFDEARELLHPGRCVYVSHLPGQTWKRTFELCGRLVAAGFEAVPHIPVRLLEDAKQLDAVLGTATDAGVREPLLISGDYPQARGSYSSVLDVLQSHVWRSRGFRRVSLAGHPEGHPHVPWDEICQAQVEKWRAAAGLGLQVTFVTQFFFSAAPFAHWARFLRGAGVEARLVAGLAGPTPAARLVKLARHCGVGASLRALTSRPASMLRLLGHQFPDELILDLAEARLRHDTLFDGLHLFSLGGFLRTARWLRDYRPAPVR